MTIYPTVDEGLFGDTNFLNVDSVYVLVLHEKVDDCLS